MLDKCNKPMSKQIKANKLIRLRRLPFVYTLNSLYDLGTVKDFGNR